MEVSVCILPEALVSQRYWKSRGVGLEIVEAWYNSTYDPSVRRGEEKRVA